MRALLVLLPARVVDIVVKEAMKLALLHIKRQATAQAERRRRSLLATRAEYRHIRTSVAKVSGVLQDICETRLCETCWSRGWHIPEGNELREKYFHQRSNHWSIPINVQYLRRVTLPLASVCWRRIQSLDRSDTKVIRERVLTTNPAMKAPESTKGKETP